MRDDRRIMTVWFVAAIPLLIMFFALAMERVESRLRNVAVQENEIEEFLEQARDEEVRALFGSGIGRALELFRLRRLGRAALVRSRRVRQRP
jgi:hypothetical protein